jgi:hypothetical protein
MAHLEEHIRPMESVLAGKLSELVFHLDEVGSSDWEEGKLNKVIISWSVFPDDASHLVSRLPGSDNEYLSGLGSSALCHPEEDQTHGDWIV